MSNLYQTIKKDQVVARKNKDRIATDLLSVLLAQADSHLISRMPENEQHTLMTNIVLSYEKSLNKSITQFSDHPIAKQYQAELELLKQYLPTKLTVDELTSIKQEYNFANLGEFMKFLSANYKGLFDSRLATQVFG